MYPYLQHPGEFVVDGLHLAVQRPRLDQRRQEELGKAVERGAQRVGLDVKVEGGALLLGPGGGEGGRWGLVGGGGEAASSSQ